MIRRYTEDEVELEQVRHDLENSLEQSELSDTISQQDFSDINFQIEYWENGRYTATSEKYSIEIKEKNSALEIQTTEKIGEKDGEELFETSEYSFYNDRVKLPDRSIGGRETSPIDSALRTYARELYPENQKPRMEDTWELDHPPAERE